MGSILRHKKVSGGFPQDYSATLTFDDPTSHFPAQPVLIFLRTKSDKVICERTCYSTGPLSKGNRTWTSTSRSPTVCLISDPPPGPPTDCQLLQKDQSTSLSYLFDILKRRGNGSPGTDCTSTVGESFVDRRDLSGTLASPCVTRSPVGRCRSCHIIGLRVSVDQLGVKGSL